MKAASRNMYLIRDGASRDGELGLGRVSLSRLDPQGFLMDNPLTVRVLSPTLHIASVSCSGHLRILWLSGWGLAPAQSHTEVPLP